ncbi:hypothetical protein D3C74_358520 [compost metagenome]
MSCAVHLKITIHVGFVYTHFFAVFIRENLSAATSQCFQASFLQLLQNFLDAQAANAGEEINLCRSVSFQRDIRIFFV